MNQQSLRLSSVEVSANAVTEIDGNQQMVSLPREQIASIILQRGIKSERPIVDIVIGAALVLLGAYIFLPMLLDFLHRIPIEPVIPHSTRYAPSRFITMGLVLVPIGIYFIFSALQKRYFLLIDTTNGIKRKIVFDGAISYAEIRSFIAQVQNTYGYHIGILVQEE